MKISWMGILGIVFIIFVAIHIYIKPDFKNVGFELASMWFYECWFYLFMSVFCFIADSFYCLLKDK